MSDTAVLFPLNQAQLVGNFCETAFFGIYLVTCAFCARTLLLKGSGSEERWIQIHEIRWIITTAALILFVICTYDVAAGFLHNVRAFVESDDPVKELYRTEDWINITRSVNSVSVMIIWDFILMYRCWVVHGHRRLIMIPSIILYIGSIGVGGALVAYNTGLEVLVTTSQAAHFGDLWTAFFGITTIQNIFTTSILIWRIWGVERESERYIVRSGSSVHQPRHLRKVIRVVAESGTVYTMMVFITLMCSALNTNALYPVADMTIQTAGIAFNTILARSSTRRDQQFTVLERNERLMAEQRVIGRRSLGSLHFAPNPILQNVELTILSVNDGNKRSPQTDTTRSEEWRDEIPAMRKPRVSTLDN